MDISIVVPLYKCDKYLAELYQRVERTLSDHNITFQLIL